MSKKDYVDIETPNGVTRVVLLADNKEQAKNDESDLNGLLCCPFCGGEADYHEVNNKWLVECQVCIISTSVPTHGKKTAAVYWNRRTT